MLLFLSHSGSDTEAAADLKRRILASPAAKAAGLAVWLDKDEIAPGDQWQPTLEAALNKADVFLVYVGAGGIVNWVDREVRHALTRATGPDAIGFFPVLATDQLDETILPPFARQFQALTDPLGDEEALSALVAAILGKGERAALIEAPFVGLRAMGEAEADRFFGRDAEVSALVSLMQREPLVAVVADSGAGKSSLVKAGLLPAFRGGALEDAQSQRATAPRHVVTMRPGADPIQGLRDGVNSAARALGRDARTRGFLRNAVQAGNADETFYALACDIDHDTPDILLVVDQFEELLTSTHQAQAEVFVKLLLGLLELSGKSVRVVLTIRADYVNLIRSHEALFDRLTARDNAAQFRLKRITDEGLADVVARPLVMAGHADEKERAALVDAVRRDISGRPSDLALVQMALYATWRRAKASDVDLMAAYAQVHGVLGALAFEAEETRQRLSPEEQNLLLPLFARLVRLGDTGGATRKTVKLSELGEHRAALAQKLATEEAGRLLVVGDETVEIAHEALVTQWPWLQSQMQQSSEDIRTLARLNDRATNWAAAGNAALPNEEERQAFEELAGRRDDWLIGVEKDCLARAAARATRSRILRYGAVAAIVIFAGVSSSLAVATQRANTVAEAATEDAIEARDVVLAREQDLLNQSVVLADALEEAEDARGDAELALRDAAEAAAGGLVAISQIALSEDRLVDAVKLALGSWPRNPDDNGVGLMDATDTLSQTLPRLTRPGASAGNGQRVDAKAQISPSGEYYVYQADRMADVELRSLPDGEVIQSFETYTFGSNVAFSPDGRFLAATSRGPFIQLIDLKEPQTIQRLKSSFDYPTAVAFSSDSRQIYVGYPEGVVEARRIDRLDQRPTPITTGADLPEIFHMAASHSGPEVAFIARPDILVVWDTAAGQAVQMQPIGVDFDEISALLSTPMEGLWRFRTTTGERVIIPGPFSPLFPSSVESTKDINIHVDGVLFGQSETYQIEDGALVQTISAQAERDPMQSNLDVSVDVLGRQLSVGLAAQPVAAIVHRPLNQLVLFEADRLRQTKYFDLPVQRQVLDAMAISPTQVRFILHDGAPLVLDLTDRPTVVWRRLGDAGRGIALSPDRNHVASYEGAEIKIRSLPTLEVVSTVMVPPEETQQTLFLSNEARTLARITRLVRPLGPRSFDISLTNLSTGASNGIEWTPANGASSYDRAEFSADGTIFAIAGGSRAAGWIVAFDTHTGDVLLDEEFQRSDIEPSITYDLMNMEIAISSIGGQPIRFTLDRVPLRIDGSRVPVPTNLSDEIRFFLGEAATDVPFDTPSTITPDRTRIAVLDNGGVVIVDTATGIVLSRLEEPGSTFVAAYHPLADTLHVLTEDGAFGTYDLSHFAEGTAFDVACSLLPDFNVQASLRAYPIRINDPICDENYAPPLPAFGAEARKRLQQAN